MALNFPANANVGQTYTVGTTTWTWNGKSWVGGQNSIVVSGNITGAYIIGNGSALGSITGANVTGTVALSNTANTANTALALQSNVANVTIYGGSNGQVLTTDGTGALSWSTVSSGNSDYANYANYANVANTANVALSVSGSNVTGTVANANYATFAGTAYSIDAANIVGTIANANYAAYSGTADVANTANVALSVNGSNVVGEVANANFATYSSTANSAVSVSGANVTGEVANANFATVAGTAYSVSGANVSGQVANAEHANTAATAYSVSGANVSGQVANANYAAYSGVVTESSQPNITSVGTLSNLTVSGTLNGADATFTGNLVVQGNTVFTNVTDLYVEDPIIQLGGGSNGQPLTSNDGRDRGTYLRVFDTAANTEVNKFSGWQNANGEFVFASNAAIANDVITVNELGNIRAGYFIGDGSQLSNLNIGNATVGSANLANTANVALSVSGANVSGEVANANYATFAGTAYSIDAANITGQVANANYAQFTETANTANSVAAANVVGEVANANFATYTSSANTAATANTAYALQASVSNVNITGGANGQVLTTDGTGNLQFTTPYSLSVGNLSASNGNAFITTFNNVTTLGFDEDSGFSVDDLGNGTIKIGINSTFKYWEVDGQPGLTAEGLDTVNFIAGNGISITASNTASPKSLTISATGGGSGNATPGGSNSEMQYNDAGTFAGAADFTYDKTTGAVNITNTSTGATGIVMGDPTLGSLASNALTLTNATSVTNGIALLNQILGKLVPPAPPAFPASQSLSVSSLSTYRMANFTQTDNTPGANKSVAGGTTVSTVRRASSYTTSSITNAGPGDSGTVAVYLNGNTAGSRTLTANLDGNGTYSNLTLFNNYDYRNANANITAGFWSVFSANAAGTVSSGWNEVYIADTAAANTNTTSWYYDASTPGTPQFSNTAISVSSSTLVYTSTVPHYTSATQFTLSFNVNRLSGDMYPTSDTFITGTAGGAFAAPSSKTYAQASVATPLERNLYVSSGNVAVTTTANIVTGFGSSSTGPALSALNSYNTGTNTFSPGVTVLYKTGTASTMEEANVRFGSTVGSGSGLAFRILNPGSTDTPAYTGTEAAFNSQSSTLQTYDATIVGAVLKHDQTNYSTGFLPVGPDLSSGRSSAQYFTFKFVRTSVSKFDIKWTGTIAGLWVALPGSTIDTTSGLNGWLNMATAYGGAGVPGSNTGAGGNGSDGAALGGIAPLNSAQTNKSVTATFGTVSSSSTATNEIYVRVKLTSGQTVTALSLETASN